MVICLLGIYVDDILLTGGDERVLQLKVSFEKRFDMNSLGEINQFLGHTILFNRVTKILTIDQSKYIATLIQQFSYQLTEIGIPSIPIDIKRLSLEDSPTIGFNEQTKMKLHPYREIVGALLYISTSTRPDISFAVSELSRFVSNPGMIHFQASAQVLQYLRGTQNMKLHYDGNVVNNYQITGFVDADWGGCVQIGEDV